MTSFLVEATPQSARTNAVLRNTYALLALSLLPTIAGTWAGMAFGLSGLFSGWVGALLFLAVAYGFMFAILAFKNSAVGVVALLGFTGFMGVSLSGLMGFVLSKGNGAELVALAFGATVAIFITMAVISGTLKRDLAPLGKALTIALVVVLVAMLANIFLHSSALMILLSCAAAVIFSLFILVELKDVRDGREMNYISATLGLYLSLFNVFTSLLQLLGMFASDD